MTTTCILWLLTVCAVGYALWTVWYLFRESRRSNRRPPVSGAAPRRREIIGKSRFVLDRRRSLPQAAVAAKTEKGIEKEPIFASASAPEHPRQIPPEDLDEVFGDVPADEQNETSTIRFTKNLSRIRKRKSRRTRPKSCPFWGARSHKGSVSSRWAKSTAMWCTIHLLQMSRRKRRDVSFWA